MAHPLLPQNFIKIAYAFVIFVCGFFATLNFSHASDRLAANPLVINNFSELNPVTVEAVIQPTQEQEIIKAVKNHQGKISIGGARYSMGGQIALEKSLHIDMRKYNQITGFSAQDKTITVQAGSTWRDIQRFIDPYNLSVATMQTYANFTVGGSLSVNVHGRYVGSRPIIASVKQFKIILANGETLTASPQQNSDIFYAAIGGYGAFGVITEATLQLTDNIKIKRSDEILPLKDYKNYFINNIQGNSKAVFHNGIIYPNAYKTVRAVTFSQTDEPLTIEERLKPNQEKYTTQQLLINLVSKGSLGKALRQHLVDPILYRGNPVEWRNYEASYDTLELAPKQRDSSTYLLQEYFVPEAQFEHFYPLMIKILQDNQVNVLNVSIRHTLKDTGSLMAWARQDVFSFVIYYKQDKNSPALSKTKHWSSQLIDAVILCEGSYYLPYQIQASRTQFLAAYPNAKEFFKLKQQVDPTDKFSNKLWEAYYLE